MSISSLYSSIDFSFSDLSISDFFFSKEQLINEARNKSIGIIYQYIQKRIQGAILTRHINNTLTFTLPYSQKPNFKEFFNELDKNKNNLDIASYGISDTTLEEVNILWSLKLFL
jgi:hypothetical protein